MANYWRDRELKHISESIKNDKKVAKRIKSNQLSTMEEIQDQIDAFYGRYATDEGISMTEARKRVSKADINKYRKKTKQYSKEKLNARAKEELALYNVSVKINRLELLKENIHLELLAMASEEERIMEESLVKEAESSFYKQIAIITGFALALGYSESKVDALGKSMMKDIPKIDWIKDEIVNADFLSAKWSDRIWDNQDALRSELDRIIRRGMIQGRNPRELARELRKSINSSVYNSERIMRTETARSQAMAQKESYEINGFDEYEYIAEPTACDICSELDGKVFKVKDMEIGINCEPVHPHCRCSTATYMSRESWDADLKARGL